MSHLLAHKVLVLARAVWSCSGKDTHNYVSWGLRSLCDHSL